MEFKKYTPRGLWDPKRRFKTAFLSSFFPNSQFSVPPFLQSLKPNSQNFPLQIPLSLLLPLLQQMEPMMNILLLAVLFVAGFVHFLMYFFPTKRLSACFQSLKPSPQISHSKPAAATAAVPPPPAAERKAELKKVFGTFDKNNDGYITKKELMESLRNIRILITETEAEEMFKGVDQNGDGLIDFEEFCVLGQKLIGGEERKKGDEDEGEDEDEDEKEEELREAFGVFDKDKDGLISVEELSLVLSSLGLKEGKKVENCKEMIRKVDLDGDGMVNFDEFKRMLRSGGSLILAQS